MTLDEARALDAADPLAAYREQFALPDGVIYLDGNSLGALPKATPAVLADVATRQWGDRLIRSWNEGWIDAPQRIGGKIAPLIGAAADEVIIGDTTSTHLFKALVAARAELAEALDDDTAVLLLTHVHYKTGERFDMAAWTARAQAAGALMLWDLSHSVGAVPIDLTGAGADLAVGCTYKYLNGGPGAPAFLYVAKRWQETLASPLSGWMGHAAPFAFEDAYRPAPGMKRWLAGTPAMLSTAALEAALDLWADIDQHAVATKSAQLFDILAAAGDALGLECVSPRDPAQRGSHISFRHPDAYALTQAMIARGVIGDFRDPDILRLGLTPLYLSHEEVWRAGEILQKVIETGEWRAPQYSQRLAVT
jgi:kynureninase